MAAPGAPRFGFDERFGFDPVAAFLRRPLHEVVGESAGAAAPVAPPAERSVAGLRALAAAYSWAAVLELSTALLAADDDAGGLPPHRRLLCAAFHALALLQTRQVERAADAIAQLGHLTPSNQKYLFESYRDLYPEDEYGSGSFVPFELLLLSIEVRIRQGDAAAVSDSYELKRECAARAREAQRSPRKGESPKVAAKIWHDREALLLSSICSYHMLAQQQDAAADVASELVMRQGRSALALYMYARVLLHIGDFDAAETVLHEADAHPSASPALKRVHRGMLLAAQGRFQEALGEYDAALREHADEVPGRSPHNLWVFASNNAAICLMHRGRLAEAIDRLEACLRREPETALDEGLVFNLATLYDLAYPDSTNDKKRVLQRLASRFGRQGFNLDVVSLS